MGGKITEHENRLAAPDDSPLALDHQRARKRAVRNLGSLTIDNIRKVLTHERYWTKPFVQVYLDRCDQRILDDPTLAAAFAEYGPRLVERIRIGDGAGDLPSVAERSSWWLRAQSILADTLRVLGEHRLARRALHDAYAFCAREAVSREALAELHRRRALCFAAMQPDEARRFLDASIRLGRELGDWPRRGEAHLARAWLTMTQHPPSGLTDLARAVALSNPRRPRSSAIFSVALDRLWRVLARVPSVAIDEEPRALNAIHRAQRRFYAHSTKSVSKTMLYWTEALLTRRLGVPRHTERRLRLAGETFAVLEAHVEAFLAHLDLAFFLVDQEQRERALDSLTVASAFADRVGETARHVLDRARAVLGDPTACRALRHAAGDLLPVVAAPEAILPWAPPDSTQRSILARG